MDIPVPMRAEAVSKDFVVDYDAIYTMWVRFDPRDSRQPVVCWERKKSEFNADLDCTNIPHLLKFFQLYRMYSQSQSKSKQDLL